jgi:hypothetical protein
VTVRSLSWASGTWNTPKPRVGIDAVVKDVMQSSPFRTGQDSCTRSCGYRHKFPRPDEYLMGAVNPVQAVPAAEAAGVLLESWCFASEPARPHAWECLT